MNVNLLLFYFLKVYYDSYKEIVIEMKTVKFKKIEENFGLEGNEEFATLDMKLKKSNVNTTKIRIVRDSSSGDYYVVIKQYNSVNFFIKSNNIEELTEIVETLIVNLDYSKTINYNEMISLDENNNGVDAKLINEDEDKEIGDKIYGTLVDDLACLKVSGVRMRRKEELVPVLMRRITKDDAVDFSLENYSLITRIVLFNELIDDMELTEEEKVLINQYKRHEGLQSRVSNILREKNYYYTDNLDMYGNVIKQWVDLFKKAPMLKKDIILYRGGEGSNRCNKEGVVNLYDGLISFSLTEEYAEWFAKKFHSNTSGAVYRMRLPKGTNCLSLFNINDIEGRYVEEMEILLPTFIYEVINETNSRFSKFRNLNIHYVGEVSMLDLFYERIRRSLLFPKAINDDGKVIDFKSKENIDKYSYNGYDKEINNRYKQISLEEAMKYLMEESQLESIYEVLKELPADDLLYQSDTHGFTHIQRVYFMASLLAQMDGLSDEDKKILQFTARYHDIGRVNDIEDEEHGLNGVRCLEEHRELLAEFSEEDQELIKFIIKEHSMSSQHNKEAVSKLDPSKRERYRRMLAYLKDADKLDRVRLGRYETTDVNRLENESSKRLSLLSYELEAYLDDVINYIYTVICYSNKKEEMMHVLEEVDKIRDDNKNDEMLALASRIIDDETITNGKISLQAIDRVTKNILLEGARNYFEELLEPLKRIFGGIRRGR